MILLEMRHGCCTMSNPEANGCTGSETLATNRRASSLRRDDAPRASPTPSSQPRSEAPAPTPPPTLGRPEQNNRGSATGQQGLFSSQRVPSHIPAPAANNGKADPRMYGLALPQQHQQQQQQQQRNYLVELAHGGDMRALERLALDVARLARHGDSEAVIDLLTTPAESSSISSLSSYFSALSTADGIEKEKPREMNFAGHVTTVRPLGQHGGGYSVEHINSGLTDSAPDQANMDAKLLISLTQPLLEASGVRSPASGPMGSFTSELSQTDCRILIDALLAVCHHAKKITVKESRLLELQSPCYVLGDIHGNLTDLEFFRQRVWPNDPQATGGEFLFLGDFVDRGLDSVPVVAYIMAMKVLNPNKWWMIRGNHETREVNGNVEHYQQGSFLAQCLSAFGDHDGHIVWEAVNTFFDTLPLAATIDGSIFCVHGGIPRELCVPEASMDLIRKIECPLRSAQSSQMVYDMLWSDPSTPEQEASAGELDQIGFGLSPRGCACFGERSVDNFLAKYGFQHVFRGHEAQKSGVGVSKSARLTTIFSTSRDHFPADVPATCGCVLVEHGEIHPIVRSMPTIPASSFLAQTFVQQSVEVILPQQREPCTMSSALGLVSTL
jgi:diadenosine tetraphosphatase ApaH/serine/threonine PP2A family protein phosphatase